MTGSTSAAEDIVQEVFLVVMRDAGRYDAARAALPTYLYGVARHQTRRRLARDRQFVAFEEMTTQSVRHTDDDPTATLERREALQRLRRAIVSLPRRYREVIVLCDLQDVTLHSTPPPPGCAVGTIRSRLHRAQAPADDRRWRAPLHQHEDQQRLAMRCAV